MTQTAPRTFNTKGLTRFQIAFLNMCEERWLSGEDDTLNSATMAYKILIKVEDKLESKQYEELREAWHFWEFLDRPVVRQSVNEPLEISEFLSESKDGFYVNTMTGNEEFGVVGKSSPTDKLSEILPEYLIYPLLPKHYFFEIIGDRLYIKYQSIIGGRFISIIKKTK